VSIESPSMHVTARSYLTAGIAALGVGALALAPVQPIPNQIALAPERVISTLAVELAASSIDPITPWVTTFETAGANIATLFEFYLQKPFPLLQTIGANIGTYFEELGNGNAGLIPEQIWNNIVTFFEAPWSPGNQVGPLPAPPLPEEVLLSTGEYVSETIPGSPFNAQSGLAGGIVQLAVSYFEQCANSGENCDLPGQIATFSDLLNTHFSGQLLGLLGTAASPFVQLVNSFTEIGQFFEAGDVIGAINELINIPANMTNAFLNGAGYLDLTAIAEQLLPIPPGTIQAIGVNLGGLLNAVPLNGSLVDPDNPPTEYSGGVGFDGLAVDLSGLQWGGLPIGWAGSVIGLGQFVSEQMLVTPPAPPPVAAEPEVAKLAAAADFAPPALSEAPAEAPAEAPVEAPVETPVEEFAPAVVDIPAEESAPTVAEVVAEDPAPAVDDIAEIEAAIEASESEPAGAATPAAEDSGPEAAAADSDKSDDDTDRSSSNNRRGAS
jgi:hypothetical protein